MTPFTCPAAPDGNATDAAPDPGAAKKPVTAGTCLFGCLLFLALAAAVFVAQRVLARPTCALTGPGVSVYELFPRGELAWEVLAPLGFCAWFGLASFGMKGWARIAFFLGCGIAGPAVILWYGYDHFVELRVGGGRIEFGYLWPRPSAVADAAAFRSADYGFSPWGEIESDRLVVVLDDGPRASAWGIRVKAEDLPDVRLMREKEKSAASRR